MKRKLIGTVKVYATDGPGCTTYETVWPRKLYDLVHGRVNPPKDQRKARTVVAWSKVSHDELHAGRLPALLR